MLGERKDQAYGQAPQTRDVSRDLVSEGRSLAPLALALGRGVDAIVTCAGQGERWWDELAELATEPWAAEWVAAGERVLTGFARSSDVMASGLFERGTSLSRWLAETKKSAALESYLLSASVSMPMIFLTQVLRWESLVRRGLGAMAERPVVAATGYSQGIAAAAFIAERMGEGRTATSPARLEAWLGFTTALGYEAAVGTREAFGDEAADGNVMAAVIGPDRAALDWAIGRVAKEGKAGDVVIGLANDRKRHVLSGAPAAMNAVRMALELRAKREVEQRAAGRHGGRILEVVWEQVPASASFHHPRLAASADRAVARVAGFEIDTARFSMPVIDASTGKALDGDAVGAIAHSILSRPGAWQKTLLSMVGAESAAPGPMRVVLDLGPAIGISRLTAGALRGTSTLVVGLADVARREDVFGTPWQQLFRDEKVLDFRRYLPKLLRVDGRVVVDNRYSRETGTPPVLLPGMTPTTVDVPIVAAAANAGYWSELAGGGQVSEKIFAERVNELRECLAPGAEVVFNALLLDSYLWNLHLGKERLVQKARANGAPICGVVVSAGIPDTESAVALLDELAALGMRFNAFKPGTRSQIDQVIAIAKAAPGHVVYIHVEGGKAGGHHSWEDLEDLLLERYWQIRSADNLVLCVGGGIADEARGVELLTGTWSERHGQVKMPVDAIFLGTLAMACQEATATASVKAALAGANGTLGWVGRGVVDGGITSGRSQLDADIHYLENAAARCGRLLDEVAGDAAKVQARRDEIIAALGATAKPYFGDFEAMSWRQILERMVALMALGRPGSKTARYEDGVWLDVTWRLRCFDVVRRIEARLAGASGDAGQVAGEVVSVVAGPEGLDDPTVVIAALAERYPAFGTSRPHAVDAGWFLKEICARPGKPVPFVPVIDQDVRRYYKSDSLWQAQDERYPADAVLVIPGPEAVSGIETSNEPVADLLGRFDRAVIAALTARGVGVLDELPLEVAAAPRGASVRSAEGVTAGAATGAVVVTVERGGDGVDWLGWVSRRYEGPLATLLSADNLFVGTQREDNLVRRLIVSTAGATLTLTANGRRLVRVEHAHPEAGATRVVLTLEGETIRLSTSVEAYEAVRPDFELVIAVGRSMGGRGTHFAFHMKAGAFERAVAALYARVLFEKPPVAALVFESATEVVTLTRTELDAYRRVVGQRSPSGEVPHGQVFSVAWPAIYRTLACDELVSGLLKLVHLDNRVERLGALVADLPIEVTARVERIEDESDHRKVWVAAVLKQGGEVKAHLVSGFYIRGRFATTPHSVRARERFVATLEIGDSAEARFLGEVLGLSQADLGDGATGTATIECQLIEERARKGAWRFASEGIISLDGKDIRFSSESGERLTKHPVRALAELLGADGQKKTPTKTLATAESATPAAMDAFAAVGGDHNPIHRSWFIARLAGLEAPIAHGMWTAGRLFGFVTDQVAGGELSRIVRSTASFLAPVLPGEALVLSATRESVGHGLTRLRAQAEVVRTDGENTSRMPVAAVELDLRGPRTAYVFPGQGIQHRDMGMSALSRSPAAKAVWTQADRHCRKALGFSILKVVRENPKELAVGLNGSRHTLFHPEGVLHLTQLTQVAMAVLAYAQVAELREAGVWSEDAVVCGHSVGEYNAISAGVNVLPLEAVVAIVYQRGCVMHGLVPRDAEGRSAYAMGVVRPHYAGLDHAGAEALVAEVGKRTDCFIEIVNYNVKGRQYSVTGELAALNALAGELAKRQAPGSKPAWIEVPGIDVPFHSQRLRDGVADFRAGLDRYLPPADQIDPAVLIHRYIPNLVARPFELTKSFVEVVRDHVFGPSRDALDAVLVDFEAAKNEPHALTRLLLIELLAWQFASPVRWIETQDILFGESGVERIIEIGVGTQPTLANMARQTSTLVRTRRTISILNVEAERAEVFAEDADRIIEDVAEVEASPTPTAAPAAAAQVVAPAAVAATVSAAPSDKAFDVATALTTLLALQAKVRPDQVGPADTIDGLFDGVSSRRNQVLMDLGAEFECGSIDRAHELPLTELAAEVSRRAPRYKAPGAYLAKAIDEAAKKALAKAGVSARDLGTRLEADFGFGPGLVAHTLATFTLASRSGASSRGGELGTVAPPGAKSDISAFLDGLVAEVSKATRLSLGRVSAAKSAGGTVDAAAVAAIEDRLFGDDGVLARAARALHTPTATEAVAPSDSSRLDAIAAELGEDLLTLVMPKFDAQRHVVFASSWASAHRDLVAAIFERLNERLDDQGFTAELRRLAPHAASPRLIATATYFAERNPSIAVLLRRFVDGVGTQAPIVSESLAATIESPELIPLITGVRSETFRGQTALVTGASPSSIAIAMVELLLAGGARVVVTTTSHDRKRLAYYRELYERHAAPEAELHVVPFNQASLQDTDALVDWLFRVETEQAGATTKVLKPAMRPDLVVPFAALKDLGTADQLGAAAEATLRAMVIGTERLIATIGKRMADESAIAHIVLPLSPNHGAFGGDGAYAESKAALEVMLAKWTSERSAWARGTTIVGARIGWVRGTGLMAANDGVASGLEAATGIRTYANEEMAALLTGLCGWPVRKLAETQAIMADLSGGFARVPDLKSAVDEVRKNLEDQTNLDRRLEGLRTDFDAKVRPAKKKTSTIKVLPAWPLPPTPDAGHTIDWPAMSARPEDLIVIVGFGEVSPGGSARTRFELEVSDRLSAPAVLELAWMCGLIRYEEAGRGGSWVDVATNEAIAEGDIATRYHDTVRERLGVRPIEPAIAGFDAERAPVLERIYLDRDLVFGVGSENEARAFLSSDPDKTRIAEKNGAWSVTRLAGTEIRVPREARLSRRVGGQLPTGYDLARFGVPAEMVANVDRIALMNLIATVESFVAAGTSPEELLSWVHPSRVGTTQGSGMGGMKSLHRLYVDHLLGRERQSDVLQETLINVVFAYATNAYVGSYGPMAHPVAACATAALSIEDACDKIMVGKADVVMAGGWDDISEEGFVGFGDMNATAETDKMLSLGLSPDQFSRANDRRRRGFVESQGGGSLLIARGDIARDMGLPVYGVVAYAGSFGDGINRSIPAPGIGSLAAAIGGQRSPLARALGRLGLKADDIAVVSKHDTSTAANDPNESNIHQTLQDTLGRTQGNPLIVHSQKTVLGHSKGGAAAWQSIALCQILASGEIPPNKNLESVDPAMKAHNHLLYTGRRLRPGKAVPLRAGVLTSLGFGHVSALVVIAHPAAFAASLGADRATWEVRQAERREASRVKWARVMLGKETLYDKRGERRFIAHDGTDAQRIEETAMLLDPGARLDGETFVLAKRPTNEA